MKTPLERFEEILEAQGRKKVWCAAQVGIEPETLRRRFLEQPGYRWQPGEREKLATALNTAVTDIWPDWQPEPESA